jgi:hypothetical protein
VKRIFVVIARTALSSILVAATARADTWLLYQNDRYGTTIDYPAIFKPETSPDADDGRAFKSAGGAKFSVSASYAGIDFTLATYRDFILKNLPAGETVTYQASGKTWFVISGTKGSDVFYERHMLSHGGEMTEDFVISYPASGKPTYDPIVARMAKSFRSGEGFQTQKAK